MSRTLYCKILWLPIFLCTCNSYGQSSFGQEWIKPGQSYFRIPITQAGFYKIKGRELLKAGISVDSIPHRSFQIFRRGREVACEIKNQSPKNLGIDGSIAFYGQGNDGSLDSLLYVKPGALPHSVYSLYSDTASYFLTWRTDAGDGKRITISENQINEDTLDYHFEESVQVFTANYAPGNFYPPGSNFNTGIALSTYDVGEGWTGPELKQNDWSSFTLQTGNAVMEKFEEAYAEVVVTGRSAGNHDVAIWTGTKDKPGRKLSNFTISDYNSTTVSVKFEVQDLLADGKVNISVTPVSSGSVSVSLVRWHYPQRIRLQAGFGQKNFFFNSSLIGKTIFLNDVSAQYYDCSDVYNIRELKPQHAQIGLYQTNKIIAVGSFLNAPAITPVHFKTIDPKKFNYLMISHPSVRQPAHGEQDPVEAYAAYRATASGGGYHPLVVNSQEVYDLFNYGEPGPLGIRNMIRWLDYHGNLKFVFLIGRSVDPQTVRKSSRPRELDMVPNTGWPGSDLSLSMQIGLSPDDQIPRVPIGRISASTPEQVWSYLQKVKAMEAAPATAPWRKNVLHLSGGRSAAELALFRQYVDSFKKTVQNSFLAASVTTISKKTDDPVEQFPLEIPINKGVALMTLFGHSGVNVTDLDIGYASDTKRKYKNKPFYPAVIVNGCATGSIFYSPSTISNDWIFAPESGSVLFLAHTFNGVSTSLKRYTAFVYNVLADSNFTTKPFGVIQKEAVRRNMADKPTIADIITVQQMNLQGDPAIRLFPSKKADYAFDSTLFRISETDGKNLNTRSDSILVRLGILNHGRFSNGSFKLQLSRKLGDVLITSEYVYPSFATADTLFLKISKSSKSFEHELWTFTLDPENEIPEENEFNNTLYREIIIPEDGAIPLSPSPDFVTTESEVVLIARVPDDKMGSSVTFEWAFSEKFIDTHTASVTAEGLLARHKITTPDDKNQKIHWRVYLAEDFDRPSHSRWIQWSEQGERAPRLPEAVVSLHQNTRQVDEGDVFKTILTIQNARNIAFTDSVTIEVTHVAGELVEKSNVKVAPLRGNEIRILELDFETKGRRGENILTISFNSTKLPEEIFSNNRVTLLFGVIPDQIPPILSVHVDQRHLADNEVVSARPTITVQIRDENLYLVRTDTSAIKVRLVGSCADCDDNGILLENMGTKTSRPNIFTLQVKPHTILKSGKYLLRVSAADLAGNDAVPYEISFRIQDSLRVTLAGVAPNPASKWFRFFAEIEEISAPGQWIITITNRMGQEIKKTSVTPHLGINEVFWEAAGLPPGIFLYHMEFQKSDWPLSAAAAEGMNGKLIWLP